MNLAATALILLGSSGIANATPAKKPDVRTAWFLQTADGNHWCAFTSWAKAKKAGASEDFDGSETAWVTYRNTGIQSIVDANESEDSYTEDSYSFDAQGLTTQVVRKGHYIEHPFFTVTYAPDGSGKLAPTPASQAIAKAQEKAGHETYFLDWPLYSHLADMPFQGLVRLKPIVAVTERCIETPKS